MPLTNSLLDRFAPELRLKIYADMLHSQFPLKRMNSPQTYQFQLKPVVFDGISILTANSMFIPFFLLTPHSLTASLLEAIYNEAIKVMYDVNAFNIPIQTFCSFKTGKVKVDNQRTALLPYYKHIVIVLKNCDEGHIEYIARYVNLKLQGKLDTIFPKLKNAIFRIDDQNIPMFMLPKILAKHSLKKGLEYKIHYLDIGVFEVITKNPAHMVGTKGMVFTCPNTTDAWRARTVSTPEDLLQLDKTYTENHVVMEADTSVDDCAHVMMVGHYLDQRLENLLRPVKGFKLTSWVDEEHSEEIVTEWSWQLYHFLPKTKKVRCL
ncbi:hypothetical protein LTR62_001122 [Meristemomyces frigidus]|uniref:Uncharacterized protein n=1 Tax=Meristemomyces frigidus TaxID=1508187 RepID=A0AAN7TTW3_9PEZI|nr:hypothetical protein LTR62_001122 [Meristemomyces frigidus]